MILDMHEQWEYKCKSLKKRRKKRKKILGDTYVSHTTRKHKSW